MKKLSYIFFVLFMVLQGCKPQATPKQEVYNEDFKWKITIPENFKQLDTAEQERILNKGRHALKQTMGGEVSDESKRIFMFRNDRFNYFESNYQLLEPEESGDYPAHCGTMEDLLYETFKTQMPDMKIDTSKTVETIDGLEFRVLKIRMGIANGFIYNMWMFSRLFDTRDFTMTISYSDEAKGTQMLNAWRKSTFGK